MGRQFGGLGLMVDEPAIDLLAEPGPSPSAHGPLADRVRQILDQLRDRSADLGFRAPSVSIRTIQAPPEHIGLGVGTQLSLAVAEAVARLAGETDLSTEQLAQLTGRGARSGIGLHGFRHGGFIVDGGRKAADRGAPPLLARLHFPEDWSIVILQPPGERGLHGVVEIRAFAALPPTSEAVTDRLCRITLLGILPAIVERDLTAFGAALEELQAHVGASFAPAQGGSFSAPRASEIIEELHRAGFVGCGQSSWGPTLYGFTDRPRGEVRERADHLRQRLELGPSAVIVTGAANRGASIEPA
jgi:beta-RFAP synthase